MTPPTLPQHEKLGNLANDIENIAKTTTVWRTFLMASAEQIE